MQSFLAFLAKLIAVAPGEPLTLSISPPLALMMAGLAAFVRRYR